MPKTDGRFRHGYATKKNEHPLYATWEAMRSRCNNPNSTGYVDYGGRGIKICDRWNKFENFLADVGERPPNHTADRIDTDKDYAPENFRWATPEEQAQSKRPIRTKLSQFSTAELLVELLRREIHG